MENYKELYESLQREFETYKRQSIKWSVEDFTLLKKEGWQITAEQAEQALEEMICDHDCEFGITWDTIHSYYEDYGEQVEKGTELWRHAYEDEDEEIF